MLLRVLVTGSNVVAVVRTSGPILCSNYWLLGRDSSVANVFHYVLLEFSDLLLERVYGSDGST